MPPETQVPRIELTGGEVALACIRFCEIYGDPTHFGIDQLESDLIDEMTPPLDQAIWPDWVAAVLWVRGIELLDKSFMSKLSPVRDRDGREGAIAVRQMESSSFSSTNDGFNLGNASLGNRYLEPSAYVLFHSLASWTGWKRGTTIHDFACELGAIREGHASRAMMSRWAQFFSDS